ncbi:zinc finger, RING/FYVE/PHD-type [Artemisia annua]|uniref:RING-type E3 ubiquitin transferase n=1 Tax=Artemisia annua TaxID=35608 RepID=A0A2U1KS17_ARTAN|nr:zinc finger, RING/FYVE/PHD-type [Artemisia annua]
MLKFIAFPANPQRVLTFIIACLIIFSNFTLSHSSFSPDNGEKYSNSDSVSKFEPSLVVVVGALSIVFSLTFITLIYIKCCHTPSSDDHHEIFGNISTRKSRCSGLDKTIIELLPSFKFSTLKGWKNGLECSVCLSAFEDVEVLRLLPKCKHAFHIDCIDQWLEKHSTCPLCRVKVIEDDIALFTNSSSLRFNVSEPSSLGLFIEREGSSRFGTNIEKDEILHKFNHRIMVCDDHDPMMLKTRWSNVSSSDLLFLKSEMITCVSSNRLDNHLCVGIEGNSGGDREPEVGPRKSCERRSVSEITIHPRFLEGEVKVEEERLRRLWLPIARRTVEQFANKDISSTSGQRLHIDTKSNEFLDV